MKKLLRATLLVALTLCLLGFASAESRTRQEAVDWANARLNEAWQTDYDGINGCQDIDLIKYYYAFLGQNRVYGYGYAYLNCALPTGWTRSSVPQAGDIVVWGANVGIAGQYGHVGIVTEVSGSNITYVATNDGAVQCTRHTLSRYNASTYIHPLFATYADLDINWRIDGVNENSAQSAGTVDVYINGVKVADDVSDYYAQHISGSSYEIKDVKAKNGYTYAGVYSGALTGYLNGSTELRLMFNSTYTPTSSSGVIITGSDVPVRNYPSASATQLGTVQKDTVFAYLGSAFTDYRGVNWYNISYYGQSAWVSSRLSRLSSDASDFSSGDSVYVDSVNTNIRDNPSLNSKILGVAYKGSSWTYLGSTATDDRGMVWYLISYKGSTAWISSKYTRLVHSESSYDWGGSDWGSDDWGGYTPKISYVTQSAYLVSNNPKVDGEKAFDGDQSTCWCVSEYNHSFGQWVEVTYSAARTVGGFEIINGYNKIIGSNDYWKLNSRVSNIAVYCDNTYIGAYKLSDTRVVQNISFTYPVTGTSFKFVIRGAYSGTKYDDVCISEITLY